MIKKYLRQLLNAVYRNGQVFTSPPARQVPIPEHALDAGEAGACGNEEQPGVPRRVPVLLRLYIER